MTDNPLLRGGDELDIMIDAAKREIRSQFMQHWRIIRKWEPAPCPPRVLIDSGRIPYLDEVERPRRWFRS